MKKYLLFSLIVLPFIVQAQHISMSGRVHNEGIISAISLNTRPQILTLAFGKPPALWSTDNKKCVREFKASFRTPEIICLSPDENSMYFIVDDTLYMWDIVSGSLRNHYYLNHFKFDPLFSPDSKSILMRNFMDSVFLVRSVETGALLFRLGHTSNAEYGCFSPDGKIIATFSWDKKAKLWDASSGKLIHSFDYSESIQDVGFTPDSKVLAVRHSSNELTFWNVATFNPEKKIRVPGLQKTALLSPDGKKFAAVCDSSHGITMYDFATFEPLLVFKPEEYVYKCSFSPDGRFFYTYNVNPLNVKLWNVSDGRLIANLSGHSNLITSVMFSPDSKLVATASWDFSAKVWDCESGKLLLDLKKHNDEVNTIAFSSDSRKLITASWDNTVKIWDLTSGKVIAEINGRKQK